MLIVILAFLGLCAGSFVNALVWRLHKQATGHRKQDIAKANLNPKSSVLSPQSLSILQGRSMCPNCGHELAAKDLVPVFSWLFLRGRCRYCIKPISWQYPLVELAAAFILVSSYIWWPFNLTDNGQKLLFISWLLSSIGLLALLVYDYKWMLLPNKIIYPTLFAAAVGRLGYILFFSNRIGHEIWYLVLSLVVASGVFWLLYIYSKGKWIGYGDVRLGLVTGTLLATPQKAFGMIFVASILGTLFALPSLVAGKREMASRIPFGPFLIIATYILVLFGERLGDLYNRLLV